MKFAFSPLIFTLFILSLLLAVSSVVAKTITVPFRTFKTNFYHIFNSDNKGGAFDLISPGIWIYSKEKERFLTNSEAFKLLGLSKAFPYLNNMPASITIRSKDSAPPFVHYSYKKLLKVLPAANDQMDYVVLFNDLTKKAALSNQRVMMSLGGHPKPAVWPLTQYLEKVTDNHTDWLVYRTAQVW